MGALSLVGAWLTLDRSRAQVLVNGDVAHTAYLPADVPWLSRSFLPLALTLSDEGRLSFAFNEALVIDDLLLLELRPAADWDLTLSARTGEAQPDAYDVESLRVLRLVGDRPTVVPIEVSSPHASSHASGQVSLNMQDSSPSPRW